MTYLSCYESMSCVFFIPTQYPASVVVMLIILLYGFLHPYVSRVGTLLELFLSLDVLVLLLLRNISQATDELQMLTNILPGRSLECVDGVQTPTRLAWLLFAFYYIPLAVSVICAVVWIFIKVK